MMLTMSAGFLRCAFETALATDTTGSSSRTCSAWSPLRPWTRPNSTRAPGLSVEVPAGSASARTETAPSSSLCRKPNPFSASYHFTLPVGTVGTSLLAAGRQAPQCLGGPQGPGAPAYGRLLAGSHAD